jgi:hypothetical protein
MMTSREDYPDLAWLARPENMWYKYAPDIAAILDEVDRLRKELANRGHS